MHKYAQLCILLSHISLISSHIFSCLSIITSLCIISNGILLENNKKSVRKLLFSLDKNIILTTKNFFSKSKVYNLFIFQCFVFVFYHRISYKIRFTKYKNVLTNWLDYGIIQSEFNILTLCFQMLCTCDEHSIKRYNIVQVIFWCTVLYQINLI